MQGIPPIHTHQNKFSQTFLPLKTVLSYGPPFSDSFFVSLLYVANVGGDKTQS